MKTKNLTYYHALIVFLVFVLSFAQISVEVSTRHNIEDFTFGISWPPGSVGEVPSEPRNLTYESSLALIASVGVAIATVLSAVVHGICHWHTVSRLQCLSTTVR